MARYRAVRLADILLFDVGVEGIEQDPNLRMVDLVTERHRVGGRVEKVSLEAVQGLNGDSDAVPLEHRAKRLVTLHRPFPLIRGAPPPGQIADRRIERPGHDLRAYFGRGFDAILHVGARFLPDGSIVRDHVQPARNHRADSTFEAVLPEAFANILKREVRGPEQRHFDAVEAVMLDLGQQRQVLAGEIGGPDERVDAEFHFFNPFASGLPGPKCFSITSSSLSLRLTTVTPRLAAAAVTNSSSLVICP